MKSFALCLAAVAALVVSALAQAPVPPLINYQGRVAVGGVNFEGAGQFKFALVNANGSATYWSNDGSSVAGSEPALSVALPVSKGLYSVLLGDVALGAGMTAIPSAAFEHPDVRLRVWFNDNVIGSQVLTPDQRIAAVGYAMIAGSVPDGAITSAKIASGAVGGAQLAAGAVQSGNIAAGAVGAAQLGAGAAAANLNAGGQSGVGSGGMILSATENNAALVSTGYVKLGVTQLCEAWQARASGTSAGSRQRHTAVWTGSEMIVWGGYANGFGLSETNTGARFNPALNTWTPVPTGGAPAARQDHSAIWTGSEMIVWGGLSGTTSITAYLQDGGRYIVASNAWSALPLTNAPAVRWGHSAVWTGTEMLVWGGWGTPSGSGTLGTGGRYVPGGGWTAIPTAGAPLDRYRHTAVWTGTQMLIWGGVRDSGGPITILADGARYAPGAGWTALPALNAPEARYWHNAVWTGSEMLVWGGRAAANFLNTGGRYSLAGNAWTTMAVPTLPGRYEATAVWTGSEMIVWGGTSGANYNDGARYSPAGNSWTAVSGNGAPAARYEHTAIWTGAEMLVWGG